MKVQIKRNYITQGGHLYGPGDEIEMAEQAVERFLKTGQVEVVASPKAVSTKKKTVEPELHELPPEEVEPEEVQTLPEPKPEAYKKNKKK